MALKSPIISVVIPVYNVEDYIAKTLDSVIAQDIGFLDNIEIILINDGSPDNSEVVCEEYVSKYPENIVYIKQKNAGVSVARNRGIAKARGIYIHFLDSDDMLSNNAYSSAVNLLDANEQNIDFAAMKIEFFDAKYGSHPLNYKFTSTRVIDVNEEPSAVIMHMPTCVIRKSAIKTKFVKGIEISEDSRFISEILVKKQAYGVLSDVVYYYRKRTSGESAIDTARLKRSFYEITPEKVYQYILDLWKQRDGTSHLYAQNLVAYDIQWRIRQRKQKILTSSEESKYKQTIYGLIKKIDTPIIMTQKSIGLAEKEFLLRVKKNVDKKYFDQIKNQYLKSYKFVTLDIITFNGDSMTISGHVPTGTSFTNLTIHFNGQTYTPKPITMYYKKNEFLGDVIYNSWAFEVTLPIKDADSEVVIRDNDKACQLVTKRHTRLSQATGSYITYSGVIITNKGYSLQVRPYSKARHVKSEMLWNLRLLVALKLRFSATELYHVLQISNKWIVPKKILLRPFLIPIKTALFNIRDIAIRLIYFIYKTTKKRPVWIVSDRINQAGDNGEVFFRFLMNNQRAYDTYDIYFAIDKSSKDYERLQRIGKTVDRQSFRYKLLFLCADKIISSHAEDAVYNAFRSRVSSFVDLYKFDFVFLQHGIIKDDLSSWLNKYAKNLRMFVTSTVSEKQSIINERYSYTSREVTMTGLPRYDTLTSSHEKKLLIMPTWRASIVPALNQKTGTRDYEPKFVETDFYKFYNKLINDKNLLNALKKAGYSGEFYLHPNLGTQIDDFIGNNIIKVMSLPHDYKTAFESGSILLTDYSSVAFDFAYMKKPVIYAQVDYEEFFEGQVYDKGYFSYEDDGLGPVVYDYAATIQSVIKAITNDGKMDKKYKNRVDNFFAYTDKNNSQRVYDCIVKLGRYEKPLR